MTPPLAIRNNPASLDDAALVAQFVVRKADYETLREILAEAGQGGPNQHVLVVGGRGSGKTTLLRRVAAECRRDRVLAGQWLPVVLSEEVYGVASLGELWLEAVRALAEAEPEGPLAPLPDVLRRERDEQRLRARALGALRERARDSGRKLLLVVENLQMLLDEGQLDETDTWGLREALQTEPWLFLLGSSVTGLDATRTKKKPFYGSFREIVLPPLDTDECRELWRHLTGTVLEGQRIRPVEILTGGSPRLIAILGSFARGVSLRDLFTDLAQLVDDNTTYFKANIEALPLGERKLLVALAELWRPATGAEIAEQSRLERTQVGSLTSRLVHKGVIVEVAGFGKIKTFEVAERLYNLYFLMRRGGLVEAQARMVVEMILGLYEPREARDLLKSFRAEADGDETVGSTLKLIERGLAERGAWAVLGRGSARQDAGWAFDGAAMGILFDELQRVVSKTSGTGEQDASGPLERALRETSDPVVRLALAMHFGDPSATTAEARDVCVSPEAALFLASLVGAPSVAPMTRAPIEAALESRPTEPGLWLCALASALEAGDGQDATASWEQVRRLGAARKWEMALLAFALDAPNTHLVADGLRAIIAALRNGIRGDRDAGLLVQVLANAGAIPDALSLLALPGCLTPASFAALFRATDDALAPYRGALETLARDLDRIDDGPRLRLAHLAAAASTSIEAHAHLDALSEAFWSGDDVPNQADALNLRLRLDDDAAFRRDLARARLPAALAGTAATLIAGHAHAALAREGLDLLGPTTDTERPYVRAALHVLLGEMEPALDALRASVRAHPTKPADLAVLSVIPLGLARAGHASDLLDLVADTPFATGRNPWYVALHLVAGTPVRAPREVREAAADLAERMRPEPPPKPAKKRSRPTA